MGEEHIGVLHIVRVVMQLALCASDTLHCLSHQVLPTCVKSKPWSRLSRGFLSASDAYREPLM